MSFSLSHLKWFSNILNINKLSSVCLSLHLSVHCYVLRLFLRSNQIFCVKWHWSTILILLSTLTTFSFRIMKLIPWLLAIPVISSQNCYNRRINLILCNKEETETKKFWPQNSNEFGKEIWADIRKFLFLKPKFMMKCYAIHKGSLLRPKYLSPLFFKYVDSVYEFKCCVYNILSPNLTVVVGICTTVLTSLIQSTMWLTICSVVKT